MGGFFDSLGVAQVLTTERMLNLLRAALTLGIGLVLVRIFTGGVSRVLQGRLGAQEGMLLRRLVSYILLSLVLATTLHQLGFHLGVLLGAAGILTVAIGFASQTSASNLISGLFLIAERPFVVGDLLEVDGKTGTVLSVDLLSIKLRTFDNLMVRVPNELVIRSTVVNYTRFPIRRVDIPVGVAYKENTEAIRKILYKVADRNPLCLDDPMPVFIYKGYGDSALELQFSVWAKRENYLALANSIKEEIKVAFDENNVEIPFPHRTLYTGSATEPFPVRVVDSLS